METFKSTIQKLFETANLQDFSVEVDADGRKVLIFDSRLDPKDDALPRLISDFELLINLISKRMGLNSFIVDINGYRREREHLISELAKAAARKAILNKQEISLPAMNAYERRIVHVELASRPDVKTESAGEGKERHIIIRPLA